MNVELVEADEILVLEFADTLPIGVGVLAIDFEGVLNDKMKGFYRRYSSLSNCPIPTSSILKL